MGVLLQRLFKRNPTTDPIRESAALTTVYLLELNKKFEAFVRDKIEALEPVVSSLEARGGQGDDWEDEWQPTEDNLKPEIDTVSSPPGDADTLALIKATPLVTQMPAAAPEDGSVSAPAAPPGREPGRAHQILSDVGGVGTTFSFNMLADNAETGKNARPSSRQEDVDGSRENVPKNSEADDEENTEVGDLDEADEMEAWERALADDLPGPVGEFE